MLNTKGGLSAAGNGLKSPFFPFRPAQQLGDARREMCVTTSCASTLSYELFRSRSIVSADPEL